MARKNRDRRSRSNPTAFDRARDELFHAIRHCGVLTADEAEQLEWMDETVAYMAERHKELTPKEIEQLKHTGLRFCQPVIPHGAGHSAIKPEGVNAA